MIKSILSSLLLLISLLGISQTNEERTVGLMVNSSETYDGYTLFSPSSDTNVYLINNCGEKIHSWASHYRPGNAVYLQPDGTLWRAGRLTNQDINAGGAGGIIEQLDWDSNVIWSFTYNTSTVRAHHDFQVLPNGNVLVLAWEVRTMEECIANGRNPELLSESELWPEQIIEVKPEGNDGGQIVWEWYAWDHMIQDFDPGRANYGVVSDHPEKIDINYIRPGVPGADWQHANSIHYNEQLDQIMLSVLFFDEVWVIDHGITSEEAAGEAGDLLFRWGNNLAFKKGTVDDQLLFGQHNAQWIAEGLPDENQILIFNNGQNRPGGEYTSVVKIQAPFTDGAYQKLDNGTYSPESFSWEYTASPPESFYSRFISGAHQLPNGNVFITDGAHGRFFEINSMNATVWEYVNPVTSSGVAEQGMSVLNPNGDGTNTVFRSTKYAANYQAFVGKDLTSKGTIELDPTNTNPCLILSTEDELLIRIYPNPISDFVNVDNYQGFYQIMDVLGSVVISGQIHSNQTIDLTSLRSGIYVLQLSNQSPIRLVITSSD